MKKIALILTLVTLLSGAAANAGTTCTTSCFGNTCTTNCYSY